MVNKSKSQVGSSTLAQKLLQRVVEYYHRTGRDEPAAHQFLENSGITDPVLFDIYRIGYSNGSLFSIIPEEGPIVQQLQSLGVLTADGREYFKGCLVFPVYDGNGQVVNLYGRRIHEGRILIFLAFCALTKLALFRVINKGGKYFSVPTKKNVHFAKIAFCFSTKNI